MYINLDWRGMTPTVVNMTPLLPRRFLHRRGPFFTALCRRGHLIAGCLGGLFLCLAPLSAEENWQTPLRAELNAMADKLTATLKPWPVPARVFRVEDYGAVADAQTVNTVALQKAIDACAAAGGGTVVLTKGGYVTGTLELKSGVMLQVDKDASLLGSRQAADYPRKELHYSTVGGDSETPMKLSLLVAQGCQRVGICGEGTIDMRGTYENFPGKEGQEGDRPYLLRMVECRQVVISGIHLRDSANWVQHYLNCDDVILQGVNVLSHANWNNDGVDIDACRNVIVRDCFINSEDDGLCFKNSSTRALENVLVENCKFYSTCNAIKFGTGSMNAFRNVLIRNVETGGPAPGTIPATNHKRRVRAIAGVSWESTDGGDIENILVTNAHVVRSDAPLFVVAGHRGRVSRGMPKPGVGKVRNLLFEQITGEGNGAEGSAFVGLPDAPVENVAVNDYKVSVAGGGTAQQAAATLKEKPTAYPQADMFRAPYPAYGFYVWHAKNVSLSGLHITPQQFDARPAVAAGPDTENVLVDGKPLPPGPTR